MDSPAIRILIVDDEPLARDKVREHLVGEPGVTIVGEAGSGTAAVAAIRKLRPDLVFLDVQMPEMSGFEVLEAVPDDLPAAVVFVTAYDQFALKAFEVHALDYLLKPFDGERFAVALDRARTAIARQASGGMDERLAALLAELTGSGAYLDRLLVKSGSRSVLVRVRDVDWFESAGNYIRVHVAGERHLLRETMSGLEAKLNPREFLRIHRSTIVNVDRIRDLEPYFHGDYLLRLHGGQQLTLSRTYRDRVQSRLGREI